MNIEEVRHSLSHILAMAIKENYPDSKLAIGPAIENGFYYDFDLGQKVEESDLSKIEKSMRRIIKKNFKFEEKEKDIDEAIEFEKKRGEIYKVELLEDLKKEGEKKASYYVTGDFEELCKGPHIKSTNDIPKEGFKLDRIAGAYWKGDENNIMLTRFYGVAFESKEKLDEYLALVEEAKVRDHRKLGKELDLFAFSDLVGPGLPLFTPKGTIIIEELQKKVESICKKYGFQRVITPHLAKIDLYKLSGHADKFGDELFRVNSENKQDYVLKPVQCPHQTQIYASRPRSYKDLPLRYMESEKQYRAEKPGEISGLSRVIAITVEDGHSFCRVDQVKQEVKNMVEIIKDFYSSLGLWDNLWVSLSVRDYDHPENYIGDAKDWDVCESMLAEVAEEMGLNAKRCEGEAALYGPKIDFMFKDALGKEIQIPTVQLDFATPKRFSLVYTNEEGAEESPVMVHRAILGSYERFLVLLIEHFAGAFPLWVSPVQVKLISVGESHREYCYELAKDFEKAGIRVEVDDKDETVGNKIRKATKEKSPFILVIGDKEIESGVLAVRDRGEQDTREISKEDFIKEIKNQL
jgi:threonyl-tRNA synthetase